LRHAGSERSGATRSAHQALHAFPRGTFSLRAVREIPGQRHVTQVARQDGDQAIQLPDHFAPGFIRQFFLDGLDSLIEIGASTVVIWELSGIGAERQRRSLRLIGYAFAALAVYLLARSTVVLAAGNRPRHSVLGIIWTTMTAAVMFALAGGKTRTGRALGNPVLRTEGRVTMIDGILAAAVLLGLVLNAGLGWWQADPAAGYVLVFYAAREVREIFTAHP
jgi:hypothetical protein